MYNIYNINERIYLPIAIVLAILIFVIISFHFYKKKKIALNAILSIWSICLSAFAFIGAFLRVDVYFTNDSFVGIMAGFMGACATILVGVQIYNSIETSRKIKDLETLQNKINSDIEFLKKERERGDHFTKYGLSHSLAISCTDSGNKYFAYDSYFSALEEALILDEPEYIYKVINNIKVLCKKLQSNPEKHVAKVFNIQEYDPKNLEEYKSYILIKNSYQDCYNIISEEYRKCIKQSQTAP